MEVDGASPLVQAHDRAEEFKRALRRKLGDVTEIEPHIKPMEAATMTVESVHRQMDILEHAFRAEISQVVHIVGRADALDHQPSPP